jgi:hypothetical protein
MLGARRALDVRSAKTFDLLQRFQCFLKLRVSAARVHGLPYRPKDYARYQQTRAHPKPTTVAHK